MQFRAQIRKKMMESNITPKQLADRLGLNQSTVRMWHDYASEPKQETKDKVLNTIDQMSRERISASGISLTYTRSR